MPHRPWWVPALLLASVLGSVLAFSVSAASSQSESDTATGCWDEYQTDQYGLVLPGQSPIRVLIPQGLAPEACTPGPECFYSSSDSSPAPRRIFVPHNTNPNSSCAAWTPGKLLREPSQNETSSASSLLPAVQVGASVDDGTSNGPTDAAPSSTDPAALDEGQQTNESTAPPVPEAPIPSSQGLGFTESFDSASARERFRFGVHHRDDILVGDVEWVGDYDPACSSPTGEREISRENPDEFIYICQGQLLTAIGDTAGYSAAFFSPRMIFGPERSVSWQANITDLGLRQWWEVAILPVEADDLVAISWLSPSPSSLPGYPDDAVVVGIGPFAGDFRVTAGGTTIEPFGEGVCDIDPDGCASKELRSFSVVDNGDGSITVEALGRTTTLDGSFPEAGFKVAFNDHNYTPDKGLQPDGYTWHWDEIAIR